MCGCAVETLTRAASEGWLRKKEHFSTSRKQMARDTGPPTSGETGGPVGRSPGRGKLSKSTPRRKRATDALFLRDFFPHFCLSGLFSEFSTSMTLRLVSERAAQDAHYRNCFALHFTGQRSFVTHGRHYRDRSRTVCLTFDEMFDPR